ncbi:MAG: AMIN domain-containing protein, partial [Myxococcaceae bacterium]
MFAFLLALAFVGQIDRIELNGSQISIESQGKIKISQTELPKSKKLKKRIVFDIKPAKLGPKIPKALVSKDKHISKIRVAQHSKDTVRIVAEVEGRVKLSAKVAPKAIPKKTIPKIPAALLKEEP